MQPGSIPIIAWTYDGEVCSAELTNVPGWHLHAVGNTFKATLAALAEAITLAAMTEAQTIHVQARVIDPS